MRIDTRIILKQAIILICLPLSIIFYLIKYAWNMSKDIEVILELTNIVKPEQVPYFKKQSDMIIDQGKTQEELFEKYNTIK